MQKTCDIIHIYIHIICNMIYMYIYTHCTQYLHYIQNIKYMYDYVCIISDRMQMIFNKRYAICNIDDISSNI